MTIRKQLRGPAVELDHAFRQLVAHPRLDQDVLLTGADEERVEARLDVIFLVGRRFARPHHFGNDAEERAAIQRIGAVGEDVEFEVAQGQTVHEASVPQSTSAFPR
jgi:hypothetical protein